MNKKFEELRQKIRDLRDSKNHVCPNAENPDDGCSCGSYDEACDLVDEIEALTK